MLLLENNAVIEDFLGLYLFQNSICSKISFDNPAEPWTGNSAYAKISVKLLEDIYPFSFSIVESWNWTENSKFALFKKSNFSSP